MILNHRMILLLRIILIIDVIMIHIKVISLPFVNSNILVEFQSSPQLGLVDWQAFPRRMDPSNRRFQKRNDCTNAPWWNLWETIVLYWYNYKNHWETIGKPCILGNHVFYRWFNPPDTQFGSSTSGCGFSTVKNPWFPAGILPNPTSNELRLWSLRQAKKSFDLPRTECHR